MADHCDRHTEDREDEEDRHDRVLLAAGDDAAAAGGDTAVGDHRVDDIDRNRCFDDMAQVIVSAIVANESASDDATTTNVPCAGDVDAANVSASESATASANGRVSFSFSIFCCSCRVRLACAALPALVAVALLRRHSSLLPVMNFDVPKSHLSVSSIDLIGLKRLSQKPAVSHCTSLTVTSTGALPALDAIHVTRLRVSLSWLLSEPFRDTFISRRGSFLLLRGDGVAIRDKSLSLALDESTLDSLGLTVSKAIDLCVGVAPNVVSAAASLVELDAIDCHAVWFVDDVQMNMADAINSLSLKPAEFRADVIPIVSKRLGGGVPDLGNLIGLVEFCAALRLDSQRGDQFHQASIDNCVIHPMFVLKLVEQLLVARARVDFACVTLGCEANAEVDSFDAISYIILKNKSAIDVVACGRPAD